MPRISWRARAASRRRLLTDSPRPAGRRRWTGRLRQGGVLARRVLRVSHRGRTGDGHVAEGFPAYPPRRGLDPALAIVEPGDPAQVLAAGGSPSSALTAFTAPGVAPVGIPGTAPLPRAAATGPGNIAPPGAAEPLPLLPGDRTASRQARFALVNACTLASLALGVLAILLAMRGDVQTAAVCLVACVICDGLDGVLARRLGVASPFGAQLDSLADMCAFGIAAPVVVYASLAGSVPAAGAAVACALVAGSAAVRLARFNVSPKDSRFFTGVPTTMAAGVLAAAVLIDLPLPPSALLLGVAALAFAMVSSFPYATLARLLRLPVWVWLVPLAAALVDARLTFVGLVAVYLLSGPVLWVHHRRRPA